MAAHSITSPARALQSSCSDHTPHKYFHRDLPITFEQFESIEINILVHPLSCQIFEMPAECGSLAKIEMIVDCKSQM